jgi:prolyl oligopeptidase
MKAPAKPVVETVCSKKTIDPFRYMENFHDPAVMAWARSQSAYARSVLDSIPGRKGLLNKMQEFDGRRSVTAYNLQITDNDRYFYLKRTPADETGKLYVRDGFHGAETLLFDPADFDKNKDKHYVIGTVAPNDDGSKLAFSVFSNGSEDAVLLIMDVDRKTLYPEKIDRCRFAGPSWLPDGSAFLYNRLRPAAPGLNPQHDSSAWLHKVGTDPATDRMIFSRALNPEVAIRPEDIPRVAMHKESGTLFAFVSSVDPRLTAYYAPAGELQKKKITWKKLFVPADDVHDFQLTDKDIYLLTPKEAPGCKLLKVALANPDMQQAETVVPGFPGTTLSGFVLTKNGLYYTLAKNGVREELYFQKYGSRSPSKIPLPFEAGTVVLSSKDFRFSDVWVVLGGWSRDFRRYRFDLKSGNFHVETISSPAAYPEYEGLMVEEIMVSSHDGVDVPLSLIYQKDLAKNGKNPVLLYGYGAYGNSMTPFFSPSLLTWTLKGGVLAILHVRGGGELGDAWHTAGMKVNKPNTWKDAIASAEYLVKKGYTSPKRIVVNGGSAGGILVGMAMTERPDLFAAGIPEVGLMNPLRGEETPNGPINVPEFGSASVADECKALLAMDPYLNIRDGVKYPAALITTGVNDPRVAPWQPAKFAARLQAATASPRPVLFLVNFKAGHGIGNTKTLAFENFADVLSFGLWQTGHPEFQIE